MNPISLFLSLAISCVVLGMSGCRISKDEGLRQAKQLSACKEMAGYLHPRVTIPVRDGVRAEVNYARAGNKSGIDILFIHGYPDSLFTWKKQFADKGLQATFDLYAIDLPFHGYTKVLNQSDKRNPATAESLAPERAAEAVIRFMDVSGIKQAVLVGNSFGGLVAAHAADQAPDRIKGLMLLDPEGARRTASDYLPSENPQRTPVTGYLSQWYPVATIGLWFNPRLWIPAVKHGSFWEAQVESAILELDSRSRRDGKWIPGNDEREEYTILIRTEGNYHSSRLLTRKDARQDDPVYSRLRSRYKGHMILLWGMHDNLFLSANQGDRTNHYQLFNQWFAGAGPNFIIVPPIHCAAHRPQLETPGVVNKHILAHFGNLSANQAPTRSPDSK